MARRAAMRRATLHLLLGVAILDAVAFAAYVLGGVANRGSQTRLTFASVWTVATAFVVATLLKRVRRARFGN